MGKPILILILGCLPLAVLTVASFAGIGDSDLAGSGKGEKEPPVDAGAPVPVERLQADRRLCGALAERELLAGEPLPGDIEESELLFGEPLPTQWRRWCDASGIIDDVLGLEAELAGADREGLRSAVSTIGRVQERCRKLDLAGGDRLIRVLERRSRELQDTIARMERKEEADRKFREALAAFRAQDLEKCITLSREVLTDYPDVFDAGDLDKSQVEVLLLRARFRKDALELFDDMAQTEELAARRDRLQAFLDAYPDRTKRTSTEQETIVQVESQLQTIRAEIRAAQLNREARGAIEALDGYGNRPFAERLAEAARLAEAFPTEWVEGELQKRTLTWLSDLVPGKSLREPKDIEEIETTSGRILRGYFAPVADPSGEVAGYKRYDTARERANPTKTVGRYPIDDLLGPPSSSLLRRCVNEYETARRQLLAAPSRRELWIALAEKCGRLESRLADYREKQGSNQEPLSFVQERRFAETLVKPPYWNQLQTVWGQ